MIDNNGWLTKTSLMEAQNKGRIIFVNVILFGLLFVSIYLNKEYLRPLFNHQGCGAIITGSFPNFIAAFVISGAIVNAFVTKWFRLERLMVYLFTAMVVGMLSFEEIIPMWGVSKCCDIYDIVSSGLGGLLVLGVYEIWARRRSRSFSS